MSNRPLKDNELFEIIIEKMVDRWSGSIEAGKTDAHPSSYCKNGHSSITEKQQSLKSKLASFDGP
jgi:hypothetical protein